MLNSSGQSQSDSIVNFNEKDGSFTVFTDDLTLTNPVESWEEYKISVSNSGGVETSVTFSLFFMSCQQEQIKWSF